MIDPVTRMSKSVHDWSSRMNVLVSVWSIKLHKCLSELWLIKSHECLSQSMIEQVKRMSESVYD